MVLRQVKDTKYKRRTLIVLLNFYKNWVNNYIIAYGYAILRAVVARALVGSGLLPTWGMHHRNKYNAYCLADDVMEPYRPYVDRLVMSLYDKYGAIETLEKQHRQNCSPCLRLMLQSMASVVRLWWQWG